MRYFKIVILVNLIIILNSCATVKEGFTNQKKNSSDEFLVEKKSPLVMPPNYGELPLPNKEQNKTDLSENKIKELLSNESNPEYKTTDSENIGLSIEESFIEKIKNN
tara:strand:+ start:1265 stop:1585 length:321 start_codon:yes stop_codon:yes gene_type:complete